MPKTILVVDDKANIRSLVREYLTEEGFHVVVASNALRYTPESGEIRLTATLATGVVVLGVQDNENGISPDILSHIFERSFRGDSSRHGNESGLGLSIAKSIVELHGGMITVKSDGVGKGAKFWISFPIPLGE